MSEEEFRAMALGMPGAVEGEHMGHPDFRVAGKVFATLGYPREGWGMVRLRLEEQEELMSEHPGVIEAAKGAWGRAGATCVLLKKVGRRVMKRAMAAALKRVEEETARKEKRKGA